MKSTKILLSKFTATKIFFFALLLESLLIFLALALEPSNPKSRVVSIYSAPRFLELIVMFVIIGLSVLGVKKASNKVWSKKTTKNASTPIWQDNFLYGGILLMTLTCFSRILLQIFSESADLHDLSSYATHLRPFFFFFSLIALKIVLWIFFVNKNIQDILWKRQKSYFKTIIICWILVSITLIFSLFFEILVKNTSSYSPIAEWQVFFAWTSLTLFVLIFKSQKTKLPSQEPKQKKRTFVTAILIGVSAFVFISTLQSTMRPYAKDSFYFQKWSSEDIMQTVSLEDLQKHPWETLNNIHVKPPGLDTIRAFMVYIWPSQNKLTSLLHVDFLLYKLWAFLFSILGVIIFLWLSHLANAKLAYISTFIFFLHPANILYATLLDSTYLTTFLIGTFYYILWKTKKQHETPIVWLTFSVLLLFFTRAIFQIPFLIVTLLSLALLKTNKEKVLIFLVITGCIFGSYTLKQYSKFGIFSTSSFTGLNLNRSVGNLETKNPWGVDLTIKENENLLASTLTTKKKVNGQTNFNHINYLEFNRKLGAEFKEYIVNMPASELAKSYWDNLTIYFKPSSRYSQNVIIERIFWRNAYEKVFSKPILPSLLILLGIRWVAKNIRNKSFATNIGFILPGIYIFLTTVLFEKGENMRFKFFIEPLLFIFLVSQLYEIFKLFYLKIMQEDKILSLDTSP